MAFEGTGKYFLILYLIIFIVYIVVKICLSKLFNEARIPGWKAFIPFYNKLVLVNLLDLKKSIFFKTLIPIANLYYFYIIIDRMLEVYGFNKKEAIWFLIIPIYKFPELILKDPKYKLHMYDNTEEFIQNESSLFKKEEQPQPQAVSELQSLIPEFQSVNPTNFSETISNNVVSSQMPETNYTKTLTPTPTIDNVFTNDNLVPDKKQETYVEAKKEEVKEPTNPIQGPAGKQRVCPHCGTKLDNLAKVCFFCGTELP